MVIISDPRNAESNNYKSQHLALQNMYKLNSKANRSVTNSNELFRIELKLDSTANGSLELELLGIPNELKN